ncbi:hypothetical protein SDC9_95155 [bioreactor metagenome]|uniref:Uncharacterized protein n=1 Tax=bioreactor metagenome TaxID=1076179 RepID=A0A645A5F4_9ZZZZ
MAVRERLGEQRKQRPVQLNRGNLPRGLSKAYGKGADAGADLQHPAAGIHPGARHDIPWDPVGDEEVLPHALGKPKAVPSQQGLDLISVAEVHDGFSPLAFSMFH